LEGARLLLTAPAVRYIAELDATCAPPPKCATRLTYLATKLPKLLDLLRLLYYLGLPY